ncbi:hypothetical protein [Gaiella sp.]|uniref:hypothetical protein n=1 Tax=Gaiella sp. TaxID=2663207 RepID=UPI003983D806
MESSPRDRLQTASRIGALGFVALWLLSARLQSAIPFWLPFAILAAMEVEFVVRGIRDRRADEEVEPVPNARRLPGADDADLGWVETLDDEGQPTLAPAAPRPPRTTRGPALLMLVVAIGLFAYAYRIDRDAGWSSVASAEQSRAEERFTAEAARIAGRDVRVYCDDAYSFTGVGSDAAGVALISRGLSYLEPTICRSLYRLAFEGELGQRDEAAFAITVLAHEATHLRGIRNEAETECYALQEGVTLGRRLGLDEETARALMESQRARDLSDASVARLDYRLPEGCTDGGRLDLSPNDDRFP